MIYLPKDFESQVRRATEDFQQALSLLEELNVEARLRLDRGKSQRKKARKKTAAKKTAAKKSPSKKNPPKRS